jgi:hypothetical protein
VNLLFFFGIAGSGNEINVFQRSLVFAKFVEGNTLECNNEIIDHQCSKVYYIVIDIYPRWVTFVNTMYNPIGSAQSFFAAQHDVCTKDVEWIFCMLKSCFVIIRCLAHTWALD